MKKIIKAPSLCFGLSVSSPHEPADQTNRLTPHPGPLPFEGRGRPHAAVQAFSARTRSGNSLPVLPALLWLIFSPLLGAQTLLNVDFGVGSRSLKTGFAATGQATNDFWNLYRHYEPKFVPGTTLVSDGLLKDLKQADGTETKVSVAVNNAPGVWGNSTGDAMYDSYIFANNGSNITITIRNLEAGRYHFYLYGHADSDVTGEQNSAFAIRSGTNSAGPLLTLGTTGWKAGSPWQERYQYVVFRDVPVLAGKPVIIEVAPGANGVAVLNGMQISSRGTSPPKLLLPTIAKIPSTLTNLIFHQIHYEGKVTDSEARFSVDLNVESMTTNEISAPLFEGDVAVLVAELPENLRVASSAKQYRLVATAPGTYDLKLELVAKITKAEPWNQIWFVGPHAAIASVTAQASTPGVEMQLLSGTQLDSGAGKTAGPLQGILGIDRALSIRWQSKTTEIARKSLVTVDTLASAQITPTVIKYTTQLRYEILQASIPKLTLALPSTHALTKLQGEQVRDWNVKAEGGRQLLTVEFIKPIEKSYSLTLFSEQTVDVAAPSTQLVPPQPLEIERESGSFTISADDMLVDIDSATGLRQVNASAGALAAYRFYGRPFALAAKLKRIEPVLKVADRVTTRLEETRLLISHALTLNVEKAGIYALELTPQAGFVVSDVRGDGIEDWKAADGKLRVSFSSRVLDSRRLNVLLEQALKTFPDQIVLLPLRVTSATNETAQIGAASALGIRLKTAGELTGLREIPASSLAARSDELLAFTAEQPDWKLTLAAERLPARVVAEVFNLVTIGDGLVGGSATIRYGLINQGVQEFRVRLPAHWKNVEFTGPNIRRKEQVVPAPAAPPADTNFVAWTIALQDKAWGGYTLVITYDYQFDPKKASLDLGGAHALNVERETGSAAITTAASLKLEPKPAVDPLRVIDPTELAETDRALITRPVLLAYRYTGDSYQLAVDVIRHQELDVLDAVADRTQITSVLTEAGEMLTQASFMVKNNDKQFQKFRLPAGAKLWGCNVNNQPVKAELDGEWLAVSLPRGANRDEAFAVDIVYEQRFDALKSSAFPKSIQLAAPKTDVPNTYAEWEIYVPPTQRLSGFGGNMTVLRGTTYGLHDAWLAFVEFYTGVFRDSGGSILGFGALAILLVALVGGAVRRGWNGIVIVLGLFFIAAILVGISLPSFTRARMQSSRSMAISNLKQIGAAANVWAIEHGNRMPVSFEEMKKDLGNDKVFLDPESGLPFIYAGAGKSETDPQAILAYSPVEKGGMRAVCFVDGSAQQLTTEQFAQALQRDAAALNQANMLALQTDAIRQQQSRAMPNAPPPRRPAGPPAGTAYQTPLLAANPPAIDPATGLPMPANQPARGGGQAGGGGAGGQAGVNPTMTPPPSPSTDAPTAGGIRSLRFNIPRSGLAFTFTKVLNVSDEPLSVKMSIMKFKWFRIWRSTLQLTAFLMGLLMVWRQWRRVERSSLWTAIGFALAIGSVSSLLIAGRALHLVLIVAAPALLLAILFWLAWKYWPRKTSRESSPLSPAPLPGQATGPSSIPPAVAGLALLCLLSQAHQLRAQDNAGVDPFPQPTNAFSIVSGSYTGSVQEKTAQFDVTLLISTFATNQTVSLFGEDVAIQEFSTKANDAKLLRQDNKVALRLGERGTATVHFRLVVKLGGEVSKRRLAFAIPPALSSKLVMAIAETEADVEFPTAVSFKRTPDKQETRVEAILGSGDRVEMFWTPRVKRITEMAASIFVQNTTLVSFGGGAVNTRATLDYQVTQGELRQMKVRLPAGQRLLRVEGELIRTWELNEDGQQQLLTVDLVKGVSPGYRLTVETEKVLDKLPAQVKIEVPNAQDVIRETGLIGLRGSEELSLSVDTAQDLQRVDAAEFAKTSPVKAEGVLSAYRFLKPAFQLLARAEAIQSQVEAVVRNAIRIGFEQINVSATVDYTIKKAGVFSLRLALPAGYKVESVTGNNLLQWVEKADPRALEVSLKERTVGAFTLRIELVKAHKELPKTVEIVGVSPLDAQKLTGYVSVSSEPGVSVKATLFDGLIEIPSSSLGDNPKSSAGGSSVLAYKFIAAEPATAAAWKLSVATEAVDSWVRAEIANIISVTETLVSGRTLVRYDIMNAPVKEFRLQVPAAYKNVEIFGTNIRRRDQTNDEWRVELQNKVRGAYTLTVTWEQPRNAKTNTAVEVTGIAAPGVERETGSVVMMTRPPLQVVEKSATEQLVKIDARELPAWAGVSTGALAAGSEVPVLVYRYLRPGYKLALEARRFEEASVLQALVDSARLTTVVADDGQMMTEMTLAIRNNGLQHLEIELPPNTTVWSAFVAGQPVRPSQSNGKLMLPLERSGADEAPISLELTYVGLDKFPRTKGEVNLVSPKLGVPLKNARWDLYLPPDFDYTKFEGSMAHEAEAAPVVQVYSSREYHIQEEQKKTARKSEAQNYLSNARNQLSSGGQGGNGDFQRLNAFADEDTRRELETLKRDLARTNSVNLINAQRAYTFENNSKYGGQPPAASSGGGGFGGGFAPPAQQAAQAAELVQYDSEVAERQWEVLQKAQEISVAKVQPLRANLPTRGQRHSFSQVLQTEVNKPMTIQFRAATTRELGWAKQLIYGLGAFLMLWIFVAALPKRSARQAQAQGA